MNRRGFFGKVAGLLAGVAASPMVAKLLPTATTTLTSAGPNSLTYIIVPAEVIALPDAECIAMARKVGKHTFYEFPLSKIGKAVNVRKPARFRSAS